MKIRTLLFSLFITSSIASVALADVPPNLYLGIQGGYASTNFSKGMMVTTPQNGSLPIASADIKNHIFAARAFLGYQFNEYFAGEVGYLKPKDTRFVNINDGTAPNGAVSQYIIDLTGKFFLPMAAYIHLNPYLKLGAAYMNANSRGGIVRNGANDFGYSIHPVMGAGIGYYFSPNVIGDISWATITRRNTNVPRIDMWFVGLTYRFSFENNAASAHNYGDLNNNNDS